MAFRQTTFDPSVSQQFARAGPGVQGLGAPAGGKSSLDMGRMEEQLARELARQKIVDDRKRREVEKLCSESEELKLLQDKIKAAYLNKERNQQISEKQYRDQEDLVSIKAILSKSDETNKHMCVGARCPDRHDHAEEQGDC